MSDEELTIRSRDGLALEAALSYPEEPRAVVVFCHPHPGFGGTMNAPLLQALADDLVARGCAVLRFNFRGVGSSEGTSGLGDEEIADAAGAVDVAGERFPGRPIGILGWSFGGAVAIRTAAQEHGLSACAAIAPSVERKEGITAGLPDPADVELSIPLLVVIGVNDEHISVPACAAWTRNMPGSRLVEMPGANHFFWAKYDDLAGTVGPWFEEVL